MGSWDCYWGGYSPEAPIDTPVPPFDGYTKDQGENHIRVYYELEGYTKDDTQKEKAKAPINTEQFKGGVWTAHSNIDMCGQGDVEIIPDWEKKYSIKDLQNMVEKKGYSAISVSPNSESFKHAALKKFDYQLTSEHCKPQGYKCTIYIYNKDDTNKGNLPAPISSEQVKGGVWTAHSNIDMCGQGDVEIIPDWEKKYSIKDLQNMVEKKGYSAISV